MDSSTLAVGYHMEGCSSTSFWLLRAMFTVPIQVRGVLISYGASSSSLQLMHDYLACATGLRRDSIPSILASCVRRYTAISKSLFESIPSRKKRQLCLVLCLYALIFTSKLVKGGRTLRSIVDPRLPATSPFPCLLASKARLATGVPTRSLWGCYLDH